MSGRPTISDAAESRSESSSPGQVRAQQVQHSSPTCAANSSTRLDLPMPGCPQMKTGLTTAPCKRSSGHCAGVTVTESCIPLQGKFYPGGPSPEYSRPWLQGDPAGLAATYLGGQDMRRLGGVS